MQAPTLQYFNYPKRKSLIDHPNQKHIRKGIQKTVFHPSPVDTSKIHQRRQGDSTGHKVSGGGTGQPGQSQGQQHRRHETLMASFKR